MDFRLTYHGLLLGASKSNTRAKHKHEIRTVFHKQLRRFWDSEPYLKGMRYTDRYQNPPGNRARMVDHLAKQYERLGYNFVPLVTEQIRLFCGISVLFLRPSMPGDVMLSGDLDNRLKTLFDALRMPSCKEELRGYDEPTEMSACSIA